MTLENKKLLYQNIISNPFFKDIIANIEFEETTGEGKITYNSRGVYIKPRTVGFSGTTTNLNDEEFIRALLLLRLASQYGYGADSAILEIEKTYENPGRPKKDSKGGRVDVIVYEKGKKSVFFL